MARMLNCTRLTITRSIRRYRVTGRIADRPRNERPRVTTANEDRHLPHCDVICSDWPWTCHQSSHCKSSTTTAWYRGLSTIQRDDFDETKSTSTFTLDTSVSTLATSGLVTCSLLFSDESRFRLFRSDGRTRIYRRAGERTAVFRRLYRFGGGLSVANSGQTLLSLTEILPHIVTCTCWTYTLLKHVLYGQMYSPYGWSYMKSQIPPLVLLSTVISFYGFY